MPPLERYPWEALLRVFKVNAVAPFHLIQLLLPGDARARHGTIVNISSDAAVNAYAGWGGYGGEQGRARAHVAHSGEGARRQRRARAASSIRAT